MKFSCKNSIRNYVRNVFRTNLTRKRVLVFKRSPSVENRQSKPSETESTKRRTYVLTDRRTVNRTDILRLEDRLDTNLNRGSVRSGLESRLKRNPFVFL